MTDPAGTARDLGHDKLDRPTSDHAAALGPGIDDAVNNITRGYDEDLRLREMKSIKVAANGGETVDNTVTFGYNAFGQLATDAQDHGGTTATRTVAYAHANGGGNTLRPSDARRVSSGRNDAHANGGGNTLRRTSMINPSGAVVAYGYDSEAADVSASKPVDFLISVDYGVRHGRDHQLHRGGATSRRLPRPDQESGRAVYSHAQRSARRRAESVVRLSHCDMGAVAGCFGRPSPGSRVRE